MGIEKGQTCRGFLTKTISLEKHSSNCKTQEQRPYPQYLRPYTQDLKPASSDWQVRSCDHLLLVEHSADYINQELLMLFYSHMTI